MALRVCSCKPCRSDAWRKEASAVSHPQGFLLIGQKAPKVYNPKKNRINRFGIHEVVPKSTTSQLHTSFRHQNHELFSPSLTKMNTPINFPQRPDEHHKLCSCFPSSVRRSRVSSPFLASLGLQSSSSTSLQQLCRWRSCCCCWEVWMWCCSRVACLCLFRGRR